MLATEPLPIRYDRPHYARGGYDYWQQTPDGRLILGGRRDTDLEHEQTTSEETTSVIQEQLTAYAAELMGAPPVVTHRWAGIWGETFDGLPFAGRVPGSDRLWVAGGYSGHGNVLGFACGDLVARVDPRRAGRRAGRVRSGPRGLARRRPASSRSGAAFTATAR